MNVREREEFELGIELARNNQTQAAYFIFSRLRDKYPQNNRVLVLSALTSPVPVDSRTVFEAALRLDPADPLLTQAIEWLEKRPSSPPAPKPAPEFDLDPDPTLRKPFLDRTGNSSTAQVQAVIRPAYLQTLEKLKSGPTLNSPGKFASPLEEPLPALGAPQAAEIETAGEAEAEPLKPGQKAPKPGKIKPATGQIPGYIPPFSLAWWGRLVCSLLFFGSALAMLYTFVTVRNLNDTEKAYAQGVRQLTEKTSAVNAQLQTAITDFNLGKLDRADLEKQLQDVIGLNDELKQLRSPSARFDKLDGLLGEAYGYFNDGATDLISGLEAGGVDQLNEGYRLFGLGNDALRQARDELKALGG